MSQADLAGKTASGIHAQGEGRITIRFKAS